MESIQDEYESDWVLQQPQENARRKSVSSEISVIFASDEYTSFEEVSFAAIYNRSLKRGKKRASENGDQNC